MSVKIILDENIVKQVVRNKARYDALQYVNEVVRIENVVSILKDKQIGSVCKNVIVIELT